MLHLRLLGGAAVLASDGALTGAAGRRRALALLSLIAAAGEDGLSRDRALALLWPELDVERARNNLKQLVFSLRRALTAELFAATGGTLRLNHAVVTVDVWAFEKAVAAGNLEDAVARYGGPFLDGFGVRGLAEFERWVETERARLTGIYAETLTTLAEQARRDGNLEIAAAWRRHLAALDPLSARYAVAFVRALADAGDVPGAIRQAQLYERLVRQELDTDAGPEMRLLVAQLRRAGDRTTPQSVPAVPIAHAPAGAPPTRGAPANDGRRLETPITAARVRTPITPRRALRTLSLRRIAIAGLAIANVVFWGGLTRAKLLSPRPALGEIAPDQPVTVAVFAFDGRGGGLASELARAAAELLAASLDGGAGLTAIVVPSNLQPNSGRASADSTSLDLDRAAQITASLGARLFVMGGIVEAGGRLRVTSALHDRIPGEPVLARAGADGAANELFELTDRLAAQLLAGRFTGAHGKLARAAARTAGSLPAAKAYFTAEQQFVRGRFSAAADALRDAVRLDSTFALAYYRLSHAAELLGDEAEARRAADAALRHAGRLEDHQRRLLVATVARQRGDPGAAERAYTRLTLDYPDDVEAWLGLAETIFHFNGFRGRSLTEARDAFVRVVELDPRHVEALAHLARIDAVRGNQTGAASWVRRAREAATDDVIGRLALHVRGLGGADRLGDVDRQRLERAAALYPGPGAPRVLVGTEVDDVTRFAAQFLEPNVPSDLAAYGSRLLGSVAAARGRYSAAVRLLAQAPRVDADADLELRSLLMATPRAPFDSAALGAMRREIEGWSPTWSHDPDDALDAIARSEAHELVRQHRSALIAFQVGDTAAASRTAARLESRVGADSVMAPLAQALATSLLARVAAARGDSARALALLERGDWSRATRASAAEPLDRLLRAELLGAVGRHAEAVRWFETLGEGAPQDLPLQGQALLGLARASERAGDRAAAARHYRRFSELWREADPPLQPLVQDAEQQSRALERAP